MVDSKMAYMIGCEHIPALLWKRIPYFGAITRKF